MEIKTKDGCDVFNGMYLTDDFGCYFRVDEISYGPFITFITLIKCYCFYNDGLYEFFPMNEINPNLEQDEYIYYFPSQFMKLFYSFGENF